MKYYIVLALCYAAVAAAPRSSERIVGGTVTTINNFPSIVSLMFSNNLVTYSHYCGANIITPGSVLTAGHCTRSQAAQYRIRVGSSSSSSGGTVHQVGTVVNHPQYNQGQFMNNDISILRITTSIQYNSNAQAALLSGANYIVPNYASVTAAGWGVTEFGSISAQLRFVNLWHANQQQCLQYGANINSNMICSVNGGNFMGQCNADSGGPLYHFSSGNGNVLVGLTSYGPATCGQPNRAVVSTRVSAYITWIQQNA